MFPSGGESWEGCEKKANGFILWYENSEVIEIALRKISLKLNYPNFGISYISMYIHLLALTLERILAVLQCSERNSIVHM
jgi:hypothetical protein